MRYGDIAEAPPPRNTHATITSPANGTTSDWGPFKSAASYGASMALVICILFSAFAFALLLIAAAKFLLRRRRRPQPEKPPVISGGSTSCYFSGETELAGSSPICAICLSEFADGEKVRVLTPCRHGFHAECVEAWWVVSAAAGKPVRRSAPPCCPLCRAVVCDSSQEPEARTQVVDDAS